MSQRSVISWKEVLITTGVVAVMSSVLVPLVHPQETNASALNQAKRIALAVNMYVADHDDTFPTGAGYGGWQPGDGGWMMSLKAYLSGWKKALVTTDDPQQKGSWPLWMASIPEAFNTSFMANGYVRYDPSGYGMFGLMGWDQSTSAGGWMSRGRTRFSEVTNPAQTISFCETYNGNPVFLTSNILTGVDWWDTTTGVGGLMPDPTRDGSSYVVNGVVQSSDNRMGALNGHLENGKMLFAWADGHVQRRAPLSTNPVPSDSTKNQWDAF